MASAAEFFQRLCGLALYEELRWRMKRDEDALRALLGVEKNTVALWRRRGDVPDDKRAILLAELTDKHLTLGEREEDGIHAQLGRIEALLRPPEIRHRGRR